MPTFRNLPWTQLERGQGFFIPALDLEAVKEAVLRDAVRHRVRGVEAAYGIKQGKLGVFFYRRVRGLAARFRSSAAVPDRASPFFPQDLA